MLSSAALLQNSVCMYMQLMVLARSYHLKMCSVDVSMQIIGLAVDIYNVHSHDFSYLKFIFQLSIVEEKAAQSPDAHITHLTSPNPSIPRALLQNQEEQLQNFQPSGPNWSLAGQAMAVPRLPGVWYVHERQQEGGRPLPWLFFNASSGKYYRRVHGTTGISFAA